jgi:polysaccharide biosynthesis/export protein
MKFTLVLFAVSFVSSPLLSVGADQKNSPAPPPAASAQSTNTQNNVAAPAQNASTQAPKSVASTMGPQDLKSEGNEKEKEKALMLLASPEYAIGTEDVLAINVWKEPELSRTVPVRPDGKVTVPLIGEIQAKGLTPNQLEANISKALKSFVANPEVSVIVQEVHSQKFNILGEVGKPGSYPLAKPTTVLDAIALAGGFKDFAKTTKIFVLRVRSDGSRHNMPFNYKDVIKGKRFEQNVELMSGDTVIVP